MSWIRVCVLYFAKRQKPDPTERLSELSSFQQVQMEAGKDYKLDILIKI